MSRDQVENHVHSGTRSDQLATLPDKVLSQIFETVGLISRTDLCHISRLNKKYHGLADSILYKEIRFDSPELHVIFSESLSRRPRRGSAIHDITLAYPSSELSQLILQTPLNARTYAPSRADSLSRTISTMSNLEKLDIAVPDTLLHGIGTLFNGPFDLACLKTCSLFYQCKGNAYWDLRENIHIFAHPTVETLVIRRAKLDYRGFDFLERPHQTTLKKLHLIECDFNDDALSDVLEFSEGLTEFVMTQLAEPVPDMEEASDKIDDYILALSSQAPTLESITIDVPTLTGRRPLRMREFVSLTTLRINWDYQLFGKTSKKPRMHSVGLPPELETLEFFNELGSDEAVTDMLAGTIESKGILARKWKTMIVVADEDGEIPREIFAACKGQPDLDLQIIGGAEDEDEDEEELEEDAEEAEAEAGPEEESEKLQSEKLQSEKLEAEKLEVEAKDEPVKEPEQVVVSN